MRHILILSIFCFLTLSAQGQLIEMAERHKAAAPLDSLARKENILKVTADAKQRLLNPDSSATADPDSENGPQIYDFPVKTEDEGLSIEGDWKINAYSYFKDIIVNVEFHGMLVGSTLLLENYDKDLYPIIGEYDDVSKTFTITKKYVGRDWRGRYFFVTPYILLPNGGVKKSDIQATFDPSTGELVFPTGSILAWIDYEDPAGTLDEYDEMEWYIINSAKRFGELEKEYPENWISLGKATLIDGWLLPRFNLDQTREENRLHPELLQYTKNKNIYRLKNPFDEEPLGQYNLSTKNGYIEFDVTDPDHVKFNRIDCGWKNPDYSLSKLYCYNLLGYYMEDYKSRGEDNSVADFLLFYNPYIAFTTFHDGVVDLGVMLYAGELIYDANFGDANYPTGGNIWIGRNMRTRIYFPDVDVTEPKIEFTADPVVTLNTSENTARVDVEFEYENQPENSTIFLIVTDEITGKTVARKFVNQRYYENDFSFQLDNININQSYNYSISVRIEGDCSEILYQDDKRNLDFIGARRDLDKTGISNLNGEDQSPLFFNLQGVKVSNPRQGEIYIMKKGNVTTKVIY